MPEKITYPHLDHLRVIREEAVTASDLLAEIRDLLKPREWNIENATISTITPGLTFGPSAPEPVDVTEEPAPAGDCKGEDCEGCGDGADVDPDEAHDRQEHGPGAFGYCSERRARKDAEAERDELQRKISGWQEGVERLTRERDEARAAGAAWVVRYEALREDVHRGRSAGYRSPEDLASDILDRDDERGQS